MDASSPSSPSEDESNDSHVNAVTSVDSLHEAPFVKHRLKPHEEPPVLPEKYASLYQESWNIFWKEALFFVEIAEESNKGCSSLWWYPRLPFIFFYFSFAIFLGITMKKQELWRSIISVVTGFLVVVCYQRVENQVKNHRRSQCLQEIHQEAIANFQRSVAQLSSGKSSNNLIVLCEYQSSSIEKMRNEVGFYVTLWLPPRHEDDSEGNSVESTNQGTHYYYRVLIHKGGWWRKYLGRYEDVPSMRSTLLSSTSSQPPAVAENWNSYWERLQTCQELLRTPFLLVDGLIFVIVVVFLIMLVAQQLRNWRLVAGCFGLMILLAMVFSPITRRKNRNLLDDLPERIRQEQEIRNRLYRDGGFYMDYRVIVDFELGGEECHYVYVFVTKAPEETV